MFKNIVCPGFSSPGDDLVGDFYHFFLAAFVSSKKPNEIISCHYQVSINHVSVTFIECKFTNKSFLFSVE